jgi:hypothetical protein
VLVIVPPDVGQGGEHRLQLPADHISLWTFPTVVRHVADTLDASGTEVPLLPWGITHMA